jgi:hypothetical protein
MESMRRVLDPRFAGTTEAGVAIVRCHFLPTAKPTKQSTVDMLFAMMLAQRISILSETYRLLMR